MFTHYQKLGIWFYMTDSTVNHPPQLFFQPFDRCDQNHSAASKYESSGRGKQNKSSPLPFKWPGERSCSSDSGVKKIRALFHSKGDNYGISCNHASASEVARLLHVPGRFPHAGKKNYVGGSIGLSCHISFTGWLTSEIKQQRWSACSSVDKWVHTSANGLLFNSGLDSHHMRDQIFLFTCRLYWQTLCDHSPALQWMFF